MNNTTIIILVVAVVIIIAIVMMSKAQAQPVQTLPVVQQAPANAWSSLASVAGILSALGVGKGKTTTPTPTPVATTPTTTTPWYSPIQIADIGAINTASPIPTELAASEGFDYMATRIQEDNPMSMLELDGMRFNV